MAPTKKYAKQSKRKYSAGVKKTTYKKKSSNPMFKDANKVLKPEKKWWDVTTTITPPIGSAFITSPVLLNGMAAGTSGSSKIGAAIQMKSLHIRMNALWPGGQVTNAPQQNRFVIVYDKQGNGSAPARNDVFTDGTNWMSPFNRNNQDRFICIADVTSEQCQSNGQFCVATEIFRKMDLESRGPAGQSIFNTGNLYLFAATASSTLDSSVGHFPSIELYSQLRYTDC